MIKERPPSAVTTKRRSLNSAKALPTACGDVTLTHLGPSRGFVEHALMVLGPESCQAAHLPSQANPFR